MIDLRQLIREEINRIFQEIELDEALLSKHLIVDRFLSRIKSGSAKSVGFRVGGVGELKKSTNKEDFYEVGTKEIDPSDISEIERRLEIIKNYNFPKFKSFAIRILGVTIKPETVEYHTDKDRLEARRRNLLYLDYETGSFGNEIYVIIRDNIATTIFFAEGASSPAKFACDVLVKDFNKIIEKKVR